MQFYDGHKWKKYAMECGRSRHVVYRSRVLWNRPKTEELRWKKYKREKKNPIGSTMCKQTHTHTANECGVCWQRECNRPVECVYILYCIYIYTTVHMHSRCGWARIDVPYLVVVGMYAVCVFCDGTWFMDSAGSALSMGDSGFDGARRLEWNRSDNEISGISYALSTIICIIFIHFEKVDQR